MERERESEKKERLTNMERGRDIQTERVKGRKKRGKEKLEETS